MMAMWRSLAEISGSTRPHVLSAQAYGMSGGRMMIAARRAISDTERRFPVRIRVGTPPWGLGDRLDQIQTWLDALRGRWLGDGASRFARPAERRDRDLLQRRYLAAAFVARWCAGYRAESTDVVFQIREDEPSSRIS